MSVFQLLFAYISDSVSPYAWNISRATWTSTGSNGIFSVAAQETFPTGLFFKPDGTKMYVLGDVGIDVNEYNLSTPWDVTTATFVTSKVQGTPQDSTPTGIFFKPDGLTMYLIGNANRFVSEYTLTTAWDISTFSFTTRFSISAQELGAESVFFSPDGSKMYVTGIAGDDVNEYTLSTPWNILTASYVQVFSVAAQETNPKALFFRPDGTKMYVAGNTNRIYEYTLTTPWNLSTASFTRNSTALSEFRLSISPECIFFKPDGTELYVASNLGDEVTTYIMYTPWDVSTLAIKRPSNIASIVPQFGDAHDLFFHPDGTKMYVLGQTPDAVACYDLGEPWRVSTSRYVNEFSVETQDTTPTGLFFRSDGLRMYMVGPSSDRVHEYNLSTAWNVATATFSRNFSIATEETNPTGLFFSPDGLRMYIVGTTGDDVNEYSLTTAWNVTTASYVRNYSVSLQEFNPSGIHFKTDGSRMYIIGISNDRVHEYTLSTAWNISTATFVQNFSVAGQELTPNAVFFKPDGTAMYIVGISSDAVYEYVIS
jgi:sugar lactone lactonase YvrE